MRTFALVAVAVLACSGAFGCKKLAQVIAERTGGEKTGKDAGAVTAAATPPPTASAAEPKPPPTPAELVDGKWTCRFSNNQGKGVRESVTFDAQPDGTAKTSVTGVDAVGNRYAGQGTATFKEGQWVVTFRWNNGASPTWVRVRPNDEGNEMNGRRGKFDDKRYEGPYNCTKQ